jgi:2-iminobutanoate/2-iminopropanoate deaminase
MRREIIEVPGLSKTAREWGIPLSQVTRGGGMIFVSGTPALDVETGELIKGDIEVQTNAALKAVQHCLAAAGASFDDVLMVRIYLANVGFYRAVNRVYARYFPNDPPARTVVPVAAWPMEFDLEIECVAVDPRGA